MTIAEYISKSKASELAARLAHNPNRPKQVWDKVTRTWIKVKKGDK